MFEAVFLCKCSCELSDILQPRNLKVEFFLFCNIHCFHCFSIRNTEDILQHL